MYTLRELEQYCIKCKKCGLYKNRNNVVFGQGDENADVMFIGEGPGYYEDKQGVPFVGAAGKLLDKMLNAIQMGRKDIYIANIVKCRPPNNRNPLKNESEACIEYLRWQVKIIKPKIIICLGAVAAKNIIDSNFSITKRRGKWIKKSGLLIMPTYHPAALLRNDKMKKPAWEDFKEIRKKYDEISNN